MQPFASAGAVITSSEIAATMHANVFAMSFSLGWVGFRTLRLSKSSARDALGRLFLTKQGHAELDALPDLGGGLGQAKRMS
jgi:hypothetical protein